MTARMEEERWWLPNLTHLHASLRELQAASNWRRHFGGSWQKLKCDGDTTMMKLIGGGLGDVGFQQVKGKEKSSCFFLSFQFFLFQIFHYFFDLFLLGFFFPLFLSFSFDLFVCFFSKSFYHVNDLHQAFKNYL